jgi:hypothetical protein
MTRLVDKSGKSYSIRIVREMLSPEELIRDSEELLAIKKHYHLDDASADKEMRGTGVGKYVSTSIKHLLSFLPAYIGQLSAPSNSFSNEYAARAKLSLKTVGI